MTDEELTPLHDALLAAVAQQSASASASADRLATAAEALKNAYQFTRRMKVTLIIGGVVSTLLLVMLVAQLLVSASNHDIASRIQSCTDPHGACYQRGQTGQAAAVQLIVQQELRNSELVTVCAGSSSAISALTANDDKAYYMAIVKCVTKLQHTVR